MDPEVVVELRMEGCDQLTALAGSHHVAVDNSQDLGRSFHLFYIWGSDEGHGNVAHRSKRRFRQETSELSAIGIALNAKTKKALRKETNKKSLNLLK